MLPHPPRPERRRPVAEPPPAPAAPAPDASASHSKGAAATTDSHLRQLTPLLVWAVVFCDIGTSVYYVPGILYATSGVGNLAPIFVGAATIGFLLLASKYVEICWRNPDGGGVVSIANQAFSPLVGCFGGLLISVDYFLTSAISGLSGVHYLGTLVPWFEQHVLGISTCLLLLLAIVNTIGIRESAALSFVMAAAAFMTSLVVIGAVLYHAGPEQWQAIRDNLGQVSHMTP